MVRYLASVLVIALIYGVATKINSIWCVFMLGAVASTLSGSIRLKYK